MTADPEAPRPSRVDLRRFKQAMATFPTGVAVVTAMAADRPVGFTCQSIVSLSLDPPYVALAPAKSSTSWPAIARAGTFCVNVLSARQAELARRFARSGVDKFGGVSWRPSPSGAPLLEGALAFVECAMELVHDAGDHEIVIGRVRQVSLGELSAGPLVFYRSEYRRLEQPAGEDAGESASS